MFVVCCCRLVLKRYALKQSLLEDVMEEPVAPPSDMLNGACQLGKSQPSPFASRKVMYENEEVSYILCLVAQCVGKESRISRFNFRLELVFITT